MSWNRRHLIPVDIIVLVIFSIGLVASVIKGDVGSAVTSALFLLVGVWLLIRHRAPDRKRSGDPIQMGRRKFVLGMLGFVIVGLTFGTLFAVEVGQTSGTERALFAVGAAVLYLCAALFIVITILVYRRMPSDTANP